MIYTEICTHFDCTNRTAFGFCNTTICTNPKYNGHNFTVVIPKGDNKLKLDTNKNKRNPKVVRYSGSNKNCDPGMAVDIITLYVTCKLGYSPIRHILGLPSDKSIEHVIRHHKLGRKNTDLDDSNLKCPGDTSISDTSLSIIRNLIVKYHTESDAYNTFMLSRKQWYDDPVGKKSKSENRMCIKCQYTLDPEWNICPKCGTPVS